MITTKNELLEFLKNCTKDKYIYGAANVGRAILKVCIENAIEITGFIDDNPQLVGLEINGIKVSNFKEFESKKSHSEIIVGTTMIRNFSSLLKIRTIENWNLGALLLENSPQSKNSVTKSYLLSKEEIDIENAKLVTASFIASKNFPLNKLSLVLTEKCTLQCKNCAGFYPFIKDAVNYNVADNIKVIENILSLSDTPTWINLSGGESLLHPHLEDMLEYVVNNDRIKRMVIITNGTVVPSEEFLKQASNPKILIHISNYGNLSQKMTEICEACQKFKVWHYIHEADYWWKYKITQGNNMPQDELDIFFRECISALDCGILRDGKFFLCPVSESADRLDRVTAKDSEFIDFNKLGTDPQRKTEDCRKVRDYFNRHTALTACQYCLGQCKDSERVPVAEQLT